MGGKVALARAGARARAPRWGLVTGIGLTVAVAVVSWPIWGLGPPVVFDVDWVAALAYAAEHRLRFGDEIAFTYGPLGFLATPVGPLLFYDSVTTLQWLFSAIVQLLLAGALLIALRRSMPLILAAIAAAVVLVLVPDHTIALGFVLCALRLTRDADIPRDRLAAAIPFALGVVSGILLLGKLNQGIEMLVLAAIALIAVPRRRDSFAFAGALLVTVIGGWLATGQTPADLWSYVRYGAEVIGGYQGAMGLENSSYAWTYGAALLISVAALGLAWDGSRSWAPRLRWSFLGLLFVYAGFAFKQGFVRQDDVHLSQCFGDMLVLLAVLPAPRARGTGVIAVIAAGVAACAVIGGLQEFGRLVNPYANASAVADQVRTLASSARRAEIEDSLRASVTDTYGIPPELVDAVEGRSVMLWPLLLTEVAYAYDLDLRPLPTLEPYAAYTPALDRLGARMIASDRGPERVIRIASPSAAIDHHYPAFEAPLAALAILCRYRDIAERAPWHVLARGPNRCGSSRTLGTVGAPWGEAVPVPAPARPGALLLVRVEGAGARGLEQLRALVLRPHERWIALDGEQHRLVPATAADGLLLTVPPNADFPAPFAMAPNPSTIAVGRDGGEPDGQVRYTFVEVMIRPFPGA
jgi:hypothetical protein